MDSRETLKRSASLRARSLSIVERRTLTGTVESTGASSFGFGASAVVVTGAGVGLTGVGATGLVVVVLRLLVKITVVLVQTTYLGPAVVFGATTEFLLESFP